MPDDAFPEILIADTATAVALERLRGEMKLGFADLRRDVHTTQELQRETNGRVSDHDSAIRGILQREGAAEQMRHEMELLRADRRRIWRLAYRCWAVASTNAFVVRAGVSAVLLIVFGESRGWF